MGPCPRGRGSPKPLSSSPPGPRPRRRPSDPHSRCACHLPGARPSAARLHRARSSPIESIMKSGSKVVATKKASGGMLETVKTIVYAVLIALVVRTVAFEPFNIPSGSMIPTLLVGDYLFVSKYSYGYSRYSLPFGMPLFSGRIFLPFSYLPERGNVLLFKLPTHPPTDYITPTAVPPADPTP